MIKYREREQIKELIKYGFDIKLISFELDIPFEEIRRLQIELEEEQKAQLAKERVAKEMRARSKIKIKRMKERYKNLYFKTYHIEHGEIKKISEEQKELIDSYISSIEEDISKIKEQSQWKKRSTVLHILAKLKGIESYQLMIEQSEKIIHLLQSKELEHVSIVSEDRIEWNINRYRKKFIRKLAESIDIAQSQTEEIEELNQLKRKLTYEIIKSSPTYAGAISSKINNKITKINEKKAIAKIRNNVPESIEFIIKKMAYGDLNMQEAREAIDKEVQSRKESQPNTKFSLTEEQLKRQILMQITINLREKPEQYHIVDPEITIMKLQELCEMELTQAISTIIKNLINAKDFKRAKEVLVQFSNKKNNSLIGKSIRILKNEIRNAEIGHMVLRGMNMNATEEEELEYFELIEEGLEKKNITLSAIPLGKSQDGLRNITLADIWQVDKIRG